LYAGHLKGANPPPLLAPGRPALYRLDVLQVDHNSPLLDIASPFTTGNTLVDFNLGDAVNANFTALAPAIRIHTCGNGNWASPRRDPYEIDAADLLMRHLEASPSLPSLFVVPAQLHPDQLLSNSMRGVMSRLVEMCDKRAVEYIWEEEGHWRCESMVSTAFWRRARKIKEEKAKTSAAGGAE
jgi:hypothetical protein